MDSFQKVNLRMKVGRTDISSISYGSANSQSPLRAFFTKQAIGANHHLLAAKPAKQRRTKNMGKAKTASRKLLNCASANLQIVSALMQKDEPAKAQKFLRLASRAISIARQLQGKSNIRAYGAMLRAGKINGKGLDYGVLRLYDASSKVHAAIAYSHLQLAEASDKGTREEADKALVHALVSLHYNARHAPALAALAFACLLLEKYENGLTAINFAIRHSAKGKSAPYILARAEFYRMLGRKSEMVFDLECFILNGESGPRQAALVMLAGNCIENKELDKGVSFLMEALSIPYLEDFSGARFSTFYFTIGYAAASLNECKRKKDAETLMGAWRHWANSGV